MATGELHGRLKCRAGIAFGLLKPQPDVVSYLVERQRCELQPHCLLEQRTLRVREQLLHQTGRGSSERVGSDALMVLDDASDLAVSAPDGEDVLHFIEHDERPLA